MEKAKLEEFERALRDCVRGDVSFDEVTRGIYATDASFYQITPVAVVLPRNEADVRAAVKVAAEHSVTVVPRGGGTSLGGQAVGHEQADAFYLFQNPVQQVERKEKERKFIGGCIAPHAVRLFLEQGKYRLQDLFKHCHSFGLSHVGAYE